MKVLLALLAMVAVSQAAFTGTLQQRAQPLVNQAMFKLQLASGRSSRGISEIIAGILQPHVDNVLNAINEHAENAQNLIQGLPAIISSVTQALGGHVENVVAALQEHIPSQLQSILQGLLSGKNGKIDVGSIVSAISGHIDTVTDQANALISHAQYLASQLTMDNLMNWLAGQMGLQGRGLWSWISGGWDALTDAAGNAWDTVTDAAGNAWDAATAHAWQTWQQVSGVASNVAGTTMDAVSQMASEFIADAQQNINVVSAQTALQFQDFMSQWQNQLGDTWGQLTDTVGQIVQNGANNAGRRF